jgi:hypothetical protein
VYTETRVGFGRARRKICALPFTASFLSCAVSGQHVANTHTHLAHVEALKLFDVVMHILRRDHFEKLHVVVGVEFGHVPFCRWLRAL